MLYYYTIKTLARKILRSFLFISYCSLLLLQTTSAHAHPHAWIDVKSEILFNNNGKITGLRQTWVFDEFYTEFAVQDFALIEKGKINSANLLRLGKDNLNNLKDFGYFTNIYSNKTKLKITEYQDVASDFLGKRIRLSFTLPLENPISPRQHQVSYQIYDPSYYVEIKHSGHNSITLKANPGCAATLEPPKPNTEFISLAAALDKNATGPDDLGSAFAERIVISCKENQ